MSTAARRLVFIFREEITPCRPLGYRVSKEQHAAYHGSRPHFIDVDQAGREYAVYDVLVIVVCADQITGFLEEEFQRLQGRTNQVDVGGLVFQEFYLAVSLSALFVGQDKLTSI